MGNERVYEALHSLSIDMEGKGTDFSRNSLEGNLENLNKSFTPK